VGPARAPKILRRSYWDLDRDPGETDPLQWKEGSAAGRRLLELVASDPDPAGRPQHYRKGELSAENEEILRELGYVR
jgi:hypothetical protein